MFLNRNSAIKPRDYLERTWFMHNCLNPGMTNNLNQWLPKNAVMKSKIVSHLKPYIMGDILCEGLLVIFRDIGDEIEINKFHFKNEVLKIGSYSSLESLAYEYLNERMSDTSNTTGWGCVLSASGSVFDFEASEDSIVNYFIECGMLNRQRFIIEDQIWKSKR